MDMIKSCNIETNEADSDYYKCVHCSFMLPKKGHNYLHHSCFADIDVLKEDIFVDNFNCLFRGAADTTQESKEVANDDVNDNDEQSSSSAGKKKTRNKEDKAWADYDELLINAIMKRPCLWNHTIPVKQRSPLIVKDAWFEVKKEIDDKFEIEIIKKRWRNFRDSYKKARNKMIEYIPSGSEAPETNKKKDSFRYYDQMEFLNDSMISRPSISNISEDMSHAFNLNPSSSSDSNKHSVENEENRDENISGTNSSDFTSFSERTKRPKKQSSDAEFKKDLLKVLSEGSKTPDGVEGFLLYLGDILRKLPYKNRRQLENKIWMYTLEVEEEAGLL